MIHLKCTNKLAKTTTQPEQQQKPQLTFDKVANAAVVNTL